MKFEKITENVENISLLPDDPALTPEQLKKEFDKGNRILKDGFNKNIDELNKINDNSLNRNVISAKARQQAITKNGSTSIKVNLVDKVQVGDKFTIENGGIKVGKDVKTILISAKVLMDVETLEFQFIYIHKNGIALERSDGYGKYITLNISPFLCDVKEGDTFELYVMTSANATVQAESKITIEAIE